MKAWDKKRRKVLEERKRLLKRERFKLDMELVKNKNERRR